MTEPKEVLPDAEYLTEIVPMNHPLVALCRLLGESGLKEVKFGRHPQLPADLLVNASPASWEVIREAQARLSAKPEYEALELAAQGINVSDLGIGKGTIGGKMEELERLLSRCDKSIIPEDLRNRIRVSVCQEAAHLLDVAGELTIAPKSWVRQKRQFAKSLRSVAAEFGGKPIDPQEVEEVVRELINRRIKTDALEERPSS